jgi:uncharacterized protein YidB (DUF937 family)
MDVSNLLEGLTGAAGEVKDPSAAIAGVQQLINESGGVDGLLQKLHAGGLGEQAQSWVSTGPNQPVEPEQLASALGPETVQKLSTSTGISVQSLLPLLATLLPMLINHLTPSGKAPAPGTPENTPDLGGLLGGLLGQGGLGDLLGGKGGLGGLLGG